jgi:hypothetical protein
MKEKYLKLIAEEDNLRDQLLNNSRKRIELWNSMSKEDRIDIKNILEGKESK